MVLSPNGSSAGSQQLVASGGVMPHLQGICN
jgi:hypothetical protein